MKAYLNIDASLLPKTVRKGVYLNKEELWNKMSEKVDPTEDIYEFLEANQMVAKDLDKIIFDYENCDFCGKDFGDPLLCGYKAIKNEFSYWGCMAGGDWEIPIYFIIYWDGKALRGYVPVCGNTYNLNLKCAFGSENEVAGPLDWRVTSDQYDELTLDARVDLYCKANNIPWVKGDDLSLAPHCIETDIRRKFSL